MSPAATASSVLSLLTGPRAAQALAAALPRGTQIRELRPRRVSSTPPARILVRYDAVLRWPDGRDRNDIVVAAYGPLPEGVATARIAGEKVAVWRMSEDPSLPGLAIAFDPDRLAELFAARGLRDLGFEAKPRGYVPERRAVLEVTSRGATDERVFVKVLPADEARRVTEIHERLRAAVPVPSATLVDPAGLLVVRTVEGRTLRSALEHAPAEAPAPEAVVELSSAIARVPLEGECAWDPARSLATATESLQNILPDESERVQRIVDAIGELSPQPRATVHGDFHPGQILVEGGAITGLIDVDGAGAGEQVDDLAVLGAWLEVLAAEAGEAHVADYRDAVLARAGGVVDADELRRRIGVCLFGRVLAPYQRARPDWRSQMLRRLDVTERWAAQL